MVMRIKPSSASLVRVIANIFVLAMSVFLLSIFIAITIVPRLVIGGETYVVASGSMTPTLREGDVIVVDSSIDVTGLKNGDIITYLVDASDGFSTLVIVHRIVESGVGPDGKYVFWTKGDANTEMDLPITELDVTGRVLYSVPFVGALTSTKYSGTIILCLGFFMALLFVSIVRQSKNRKKVTHAKSETP